MVSRIKALCKEKGISVKRMEAECGLKDSTVNKWDEKRPSADRLHAVASYFGVSMEYLLTGEEKAPAHEEPELSEDEAILLSAFRSLTEDQRKFVLRQLSAAAQEPEGQAAAE